MTVGELWDGTTRVLALCPHPAEAEAGPAALSALPGPTSTPREGDARESKASRWLCVWLNCVPLAVPYVYQVLLLCFHARIPLPSRALSRRWR